MWAKMRFSEGDFPQAAQELIERLKFKKAIFEEVKSDAMRNWKLQNIQEFTASIQEYMASRETPTLHDFLSTTMLGSDEAGFKKGSKPR